MIRFIYERYSLTPFMSTDDPTPSRVSNGNSQRINDAAVGRLLCFMRTRKGGQKYSYYMTRHSPSDCFFMVERETLILCLVPPPFRKSSSFSRAFWKFCATEARVSEAQHM